MKNRLLSAFVLIGLMLFSTLGTMAFMPSLSTSTEKQTMLNTSNGETNFSYSLANVLFLIPEPGWRSPEPIRYIKPEDDSKYNNRVINGILNEKDKTISRCEHQRS